MSPVADRRSPILALCNSCVAFINGPARLNARCNTEGHTNEDRQTSRPPAGLRRLLFRSPISIYRVGLGAVFGRRLLLLHHTGRRTGASRKTVLEVVQYDPTDRSYVVASGWGPQAAWYRNILEQPEVSVEVGNRTIPVTAEPLAEDVGAEIFARYAARRPRIAAVALPWVLGMSVDGSDADFRAAGRRMPFVRLAPRPPA